jgi:hypothetical protein
VTFSLSAVTTAGRCLVAFVAIADTTRSVTSFQDDAPAGDNPFTLVDVVTVSGVRLECWATPPAGSNGSASFLRANLSGMTPAAAVVAECALPSAHGLTVTDSNTTADPSLTLTTQDAGNFLIGGFATVGSTLATSKTGTLHRTRNSAGLTPVVCSLVSNSSPSPEAVTTAITRSATTWAAIGLELRAPALLAQDGYRWRNDDGPEVGGTWKAAENTPVNLAADEIARLRMRVSVSGDPDSKQFKLQYRKVGDASWRDVDKTG